MKTRKQELREIMIDIISGKEKVRYTPNQQAHLLIGVAEVLIRRGEPPNTSRSFHSGNDPELHADDELLAMEIFWDLIIDRIITPGMDKVNPLPHFRIHSEAGLERNEIPR